MNWTVLIIVVAFVGALFGLKQMTLVSAAAARNHLASGALVIDVRSPEEFRSGHARVAINIPLEDLRDELPRRVPDRSRVLLVHCLSGTRSGIAQHQLKGMGYTHVFNLGSLGRAKRIVGDTKT